ncbi:hypothetical protein H7F15_02755 [Pontibacter sp. Tf4]|uniref:hypothetical protein n=1 Tax=Pontibacter sp. Tf4 TaxID=2761620 RepID=UPI00162624E2|nr:hypothetical protein [Pontibacter sp. Tf4]MBB6609945.1 hypothetical protein [Pontibacter sp. Tf4]
MQEVKELLNKLTKSDSVLVTELKNRSYCRFFRDGQYIDRMFVTNPALLAELLPLVGEAYEIDATGIATLAQRLTTSDKLSSVDTL